MLFSILGGVMEDSIFTKIINKEIPARIVAENSQFIAILDSNPWTKGHTLIIPKIQVERVNEMPPNFRKNIMDFACEVTDLLERKLKSRSFNFMINDGMFAGQEVRHVHLHIITRYNKKEVLIEHKQHNDNLDKILSILQY